MADAGGQYEDDLTISDAEVLWRRIRPGQYHYDDNRHEDWPESWAFDDGKDGSPMSVFLASETKDPRLVLKDHPGYGLAAITAGAARQHRQKIVRDPQPNLPDGHALVVGDKKARKVKQGLRNASRWEIPPPPTTPIPDTTGE